MNSGIYMPLTVEVNMEELEKKTAERTVRLNAIGTMLEKAVIKEPYKPINSDQQLPAIFVNDKLFGDKEVAKLLETEAKQEMNDLFSEHDFE